MSSAEDPIGPVDDDAPRTRGMLRRPWVPAGLLALLAVLIALAPHHARPRSLPSGRLGATIACLDRDGGFRVTDTRSGGVVSRRTTEINVSRTVHDLEIAQLRDAGTPAGARAVARANRLGAVSRSNYRTAGPIVWAYVENGTPPQVSANAGERTLITYCANRPAR